MRFLGLANFVRSERENLAKEKNYSYAKETVRSEVRARWKLAFPLASVSESPPQGAWAGSSEPFSLVREKRSRKREH